MVNILVIGDAMIDRYIYGSVERISPEAPVPVFVYEHSEDREGGAGNVASNIRALGGHAPVMSGIIPPIKERYIVGGQQIFRCDREEIMPADPMEIDLTGYDALVVSDYCKGTIGPWINPIINKAACPVIVDTKNPDWRWFKGATVITPNEKEYQAASKEYTVPTILMTCGEHGMVLMEQGNAPVRIPAQAKQVYDVTGAGDTVVAALAIGLASGMSMLEAANLANKAAGIVVGKRGTATVTMEELCA